MAKSVGYVYDEEMTKHHHPKNKTHPEGPHRIKIAKQIVEDAGLLGKMTEISSRCVNRSRRIFLSCEAAIFMNHRCNRLSTACSLGSET